MHEPEDRGQSAETDELPGEARGWEYAVRTGGGDVAGAGSAVAAAGLVRQFGCGNEDVAGVRSPEVRTVASLIHLPGSALRDAFPSCRKGQADTTSPASLAATFWVRPRVCPPRAPRATPGTEGRLPRTQPGHGDAEAPQSAAGAVSRIGGSSQGRWPHAKGRAVLGQDRPGN